MQLAEWLVKNKKTQTALANELNVSSVAVHHWLYGKTFPSSANMMKLYTLSNGKIELRDWIALRDMTDQTASELRL